MTLPGTSRPHRPQQTTVGPPRRLWLLAVPGVLLLTGLLGGWLWLRAARPGPGRAAGGPPEPPDVERTGADPAVLRAVDTARAAVKQAPRSGEAWGKLAMTLQAHGFTGQAVPCLVEAERLDPGAARWPYLRGTAVRNTDPELALEKLRRAAALCGDVPDAPRLKRAELLLELGRLPEAEAEFRRLLQADPDHAAAHLGLGRVAYENDDLDASLEHLRRAAYNLSTRKAARLASAEVYQRRGDAGAAREALALANQLPPDRPWPDAFTDEVGKLQTGRQVLLAEADRLLERHHAPEAIALLRQTVQDYPDADWAWLLLGRAHLEGHNPADAERALRRSAALSPGSAEAQFYLGLALFQQDNPRAAATCFRRATELRPAYAPAHYNLGHVLLRQGDRAGAATAFRAAVTCNPGYAEAHTMLGDVLAQSGRPAEALVHLQEAVRLQPGNATARRLLRQTAARIVLQCLF
jgi:tetratricopeptide (TPR) repeat protein